MLAKLIKHEWKATKRFMLPLNLAIILITLAECLFLCTNILKSEDTLPLVILILILYVLSLFALATAANIYLIIRFYKNLFTSEGYLMFTLPATPAQLLNSKLLVALFWSFLNNILSMLAFGALGFSSSYYTTVHGASSGKGSFLTGLSIGLSGGADTSASFKEVFGLSPLGLIGVCLITFLVSSFFNVIMGYLAIALGQLIEKYKVACSIGFYIAIYVVTQIITSFVMITTSLSSVNNTTGFNWNMYSVALPASAILSLIFGIIFYIITLFVMRKKVNLE